MESLDEPVDTDDSGHSLPDHARTHMHDLHLVSLLGECTPRAEQGQQKVTAARSRNASLLSHIPASHRHDDDIADGDAEEDCVTATGLAH